jgi:hypothetical protein
MQKQKYYKELDDFIDNTEKYVRETCSYLNWDFDNINKNVNYCLT